MNMPEERLPEHDDDDRGYSWIHLSQYKKMTPVRTSSYNNIIGWTPGGDINVTLVTFQKDQSGHLELTMLDLHLPYMTIISLFRYRRS